MDQSSPPPNSQPVISYIPSSGLSSKPAPTPVSPPPPPPIPNTTSPTQLVQEQALEQINAGFGRRFMAYFIDTLSLQLVISYVLLVFVLLLPSNIDSQLKSLPSVGMVIILTAVVFTFIYYPLATSRFGGTFGKYILGLRVVKADTGFNISFFRGLLRYTIGYFLSEIILGLGFYWIAMDKNKQGWHDKIARTLVVKKEKSCSTLQIMGIIILLWILIGVIAGISASRISVIYNTYFQKSNL